MEFKLFRSLEFIPSCERSTVSDAANVLRLSWNLFEDKICLKGFDEVLTSVVTKCVLHSVAKIFDPLGLVSPFTFHGKVFFQTLWIVNVAWDDLLPMKLFKEWKKLVNHLQRYLV